MHVSILKRTLVVIGLTGESLRKVSIPADSQEHVVRVCIQTPEKSVHTFVAHILIELKKNKKKTKMVTALHMHYITDVDINNKLQALWKSQYQH